MMMKRLLTSFLFKRRVTLHVFKRRTQRHADKLRKIAVAQVRFRIFKRAKDFYDQIASITKDAKKQGVQLVCFPLGMDKELQPIPWENMSNAQRDKVFSVCDKAFSLVALESGICVSESTIRNGEFKSRIWKPDGTKSEGKFLKCCGRKVFFSHYDFESDDEDGEIHVFPRFGSIGGEKISKAWLDAQQGYVFALESKLIGKYSDAELKGKSGIYAPLELTKFGDGILAIAETSQKSELIEAELDFESLERLRDELENEAYEKLLI